MIDRETAAAAPGQNCDLTTSLDLETEMKANRIGNRRLKGAVALGLFAALLLAGVAYAALSSVTLEHYIIDLVSVTSDNGSASWVYAVTTNPDNPPAQGNGLSHWTLAVAPECYAIVAPKDGESYQTPVDGTFGCGADYACTTGVYEVVHGWDDPLDLYGIKYEFVSGTPLDSENPGTHIFTFTVSYADHAYVGDTGVGVKFGTTPVTGVIDGPVCGPSAVTLTGLSVDGSSQEGLTNIGLALFAGLGLITLTGFFTLRRDRR
jgi:hypothetical protein